MDIYESLKNQWESIVSLLPVDLDRTAFGFGALLRKREVKSASDLLRLIMIYCCSGLSQRSTAAWAVEADIAKLANTSFRERLKKSADWIGFLVTSYLAQRANLYLESPKRLRIRLIDATSVRRPGCNQPDWRVHVGFDLRYLCCDHIELTKAKESESFKRLTAKEGDVLIGDRQYGRRPDVWSAVCAKADVIVRLALRNMPLRHPDGRILDILGESERLKEEEILDIPVLTAPDSKRGIPAMAGRLIVKRKSLADEKKCRERLNKRKRKACEKATPGSLASCRYVFLFTTLSTEVSARDILELYRFRWQIEMAFKRMKSIIHLDDIAVTDDQLCKTVILSKLLAVLLVEDLTNQLMGSFPPCEPGWPQTSAYMAPV